MKKIKKYLKIWWMMTVKSTQIAFVSRFGAIIFMVAKILRFLFFFLFLFLLSTRIKAIGGYNFWQMAFFFVTFNLVDTIVQFFLREVYRFRFYVLTGFFDYILIKPISSLFRALFGGSDILDFFMILILVIALVLTVGKVGLFSFSGIFLYIVLIFNAFLIALSFHILVLAVGVLTTEVDNTIMLYRDLTQMGRVPVDIYTEPIRSVLTFIVPVGVMMTFPAKAMLGLLSPLNIFLSFFISFLFLFISLNIWRFSLKHYSSASS